ncbi:MAG: EVE domain-containing protein, partial [Dehalococcoidia bacterium]
MNKWLVVYNLEAFSENSRMLGFVRKNSLDGSPTRDGQGNPLPADAKVREIRPGDVVVYYCRGDSVIKGLYEIVRDCYGKETKWPESPFQFEIKPVIELDESYDFKPLVGSLSLFKDLPDPRRLGLKLRGLYNAIKPLTEEDYKTIKDALTAAAEQKSTVEEDDTGPAGYRKHLSIQHQIAEWGIRNGFRVHVAINDKGKIKENLAEILDDIPKFHTDDILGIAKRIDVLFFDSKRNILT